MTWNPDGVWSEVWGGGSADQWSADIDISTLDEGDYDVTVIATDNSANHNVQTTTAIVVHVDRGGEPPGDGRLQAAWTTFSAPDIAPPSGVAITYPLPGQTINAQLTLTAVAHDNRDGIVEQVIFYLDDIAIGQAYPVDTGMAGPIGMAGGATTTYQLAFDTEADWVTDGPHSLSCVAIDNAGLVTQGGGVTVTIRNVTVTVPYPFTGEQILDLVDGVGTIEFTFDWQVVRPNGTLGPLLHPWQDQPLTIEMQTSRPVMRTVNGVRLLAGDLDDVDVLADEVQVYMRLVTGDRYPCGRFVFADQTIVPYSFGEEVALNLFDRGWRLDDPVERTVSLTPGKKWVPFLTSLAAEVGLGAVEVDAAVADRSVSAATAWPAGTSRQKIWADGCQHLGCYPPHFDAVGTLWLRVVPDLTTAAVQRVYNAGGRLLDGTLSETDQTYLAPNRYLVTGGNGTTPISAFFDVPPDAPQSHARTGRIRTEVISLPTVESQAAALGAAIAAYARDVRSFRTVTFSSTIDPRHGTYDIVEYRGAPHLETAWSISTAASGSGMSHTCSRIWLGSAVA